MGAFPSGQRGQTVNLLSLTSVVRIHPLPPEKSKSQDLLFSIQSEGLVCNHDAGVYEIKAKPCMESATCCGMESSRSDVCHQSEGKIHAIAWCYTPAAIPYTTASWLHTNPSDWIEKSTCLRKCFFLAGMAGFEPTGARVKVWCLTAWRHPNIYTQRLYHKKPPMSIVFWEFKKDAV